MEKIKKGDQIKFREDTYYCSKEDILNPIAVVRVNWIRINGQSADQLIYYAEDLDDFWNDLEKAGLVRDNEVVISKGTIIMVNSISLDQIEGILVSHSNIELDFNLGYLQFGNEKQSEDEEIFVELVS